MLPALQIDADMFRITDPEAVGQAVCDAQYRLPGAEYGLWCCEDRWQVTEQTYDLENLYVSFLEVTVWASDVRIPICCPRHDLYWLYVLQGEINISPVKKPLLHTFISSRTYRISYLPAGRYGARLSAGVHRFFYVVHKPRSLFRGESDALFWDLPPIRAVREQVQLHSFSDGLPMTDGSWELISRFLRTPSCTTIRRTQLLHNLAYELVIRSLDALRQVEKNNQITAVWITEIQEWIAEQIRTGEDVHMKTVAKRHRISVSYLRLLFDRGPGISVGAYISEQKLLHGRILLEEGCTPTQAANYLGWTRTYFSWAFTTRFGETARAYRKRMHHPG